MLSLLNFGTAEITLVSVFGAILIGIIVYLCFVPLKTYFTALFSGAYIPSFRLISLKNRKFDVKAIVESYVMAKKSGLKISLAQIESLSLSGGDVNEVLKALNLAKSSNVKLTLELASAIELSSHNVFEIVKESILSKVVEINEIKGVTQDNIEIIANVRISVKVNLNRYTTGLGLDDLKGNVSAWIMENITKSNNHKSILKEPNIALLSNLDLRVVTQKSMFDVLDINISSVSVGRDLNLEREIKAAEKEKIYAQIEAERMKNAEEIKELKMKTKTEETKSNLLNAEAEVPLAISQAIKEGRFSVMDYYKLMNLQADTALRRAFVSEGKKAPSFPRNDFDDDEGDDF